MFSIHGFYKIKSINKCDQHKDKLKKYLGELKPCIICQSKNLESWAKLDYLEAKKCRRSDCGR